jgi:hypothetical protein
VVVTMKRKYPVIDIYDFSDVKCCKCGQQGDEWFKFDVLTYGSKKGPWIWFRCANCLTYQHRYFRNGRVTQKERTVVDKIMVVGDDL